MNLKRIQSKLINYLLLLFILFTVLPVKLNYSSILIILASLLAVINIFNSKTLNVANSRVLFFISIPLLIYLLGFINTADTEEGVSFILKNLSFIAFPLIFYSFSGQINKKLLFNGYLFGLCFVNIYLIYLFIYYYNFVERFYMVVTKEIYHSTYLGMYNAFAYWVCIWIYKKRSRILFLLIALFFSISAILTSSRIIFILVVISLLTSVFLLINSKLKKFIFSLLIVLVSSLALVYSPSINQKFSQMVEINK